MLDLVAHEGGITDAAINTDGTLATTDFGETVRLWNVSTGEQLVELRTGDPVHSTVDFSPDGSYLLYSDNGVLRRLLDINELIEQAQQPPHPGAERRRMPALPRRRVHLSAPDIAGAGGRGHAVRMVAG